MGVRMEKRNTGAEDRRGQSGVEEEGGEEGKLRGRRRGEGKRG